MKEIYKELVECPNYEVSNFGNIRNKKSKRILKPYTNNHNAYLVGLSYKGKSFKFVVHSLVAKYFLPYEEGKREIMHIDNDYKNNTVTNLKRVTHKENMELPQNIEKLTKTRDKLREKLGKKVKCLDTNEIFNSAYEAQKKLGISHSSISSCCLGKLKSAGNKKFKFI